ncbi:MAG: hypothetical protein ACLPZ0_11700 [Steroidobacteraceae bacterium]
MNPPLPTAWSCRFSSSVKKGLHEEGLIESKTDWYVKHIDIKPGVFSDPDVSEPLRAWITRRAIPKFKKFSIFGNLMGRVKFGEMTPSEIWEFVVFVGAIFSVGATHFRA